MFFFWLRSLGPSIDLLLRQMAETENVRKMGFERIDEAKKFAVQNLIKDLLVVFDTLDLALSSVKGERDREKELSDFHMAVSMVEKDLFNILGKHGVARYQPDEGHDFKPSHHEALFMVPTDSKEKANKVVNVMKRGYALNDRVLRPAQVGVTKHK